MGTKFAFGALEVDVSVVEIFFEKTSVQSNLVITNTKGQE